MGGGFNTVAGVLGNVLEWYDFALFGYFSDIIAEVFFPPVDEGDNSSLLKSFAIFGGAFVMRPVGGLTIGYIGDKHGRKRALTTSLFLMAFPTFAMGCLPTYDVAGSWAIALLAICRLLQGMSVGGQLPASLIYTVERKPREQWGLYGSYVMFSANIGTLLGNLVGASLRDVLNEDQLVSWGWRVPFLSGILILPVAVWLRAYGEEHHPNAGHYDRQDSEVKNPIWPAFARENRLSLLAASLTPMLWAGGFYVSFVWLAVYMEELLTPPVPNAFWVNFASMVCGMTIFMPLAGKFSDSFGRRLTMTVSAVSLAGLGPVMVFVISRGDSVTAFFAQTALGVMLSFYGGPICAWLVESFSPQVRLTSASLGYDLAHATAGGFSPLLATVLVDKYGVTSPGVIYPIFAVLSLIGLHLIPCCGSVQPQDTAEATNALQLEVTPVSAMDASGNDDRGETSWDPEVTDEKECTVPNLT